MMKSAEQLRRKKRLKLFWKRNFALIVALPLLCLLRLYVLHVEPESFRITELVFSDPAVPAELHGAKLVFVADIHATDRRMELLPDLVERINKLQPQVILLGGDFINSNGRGADAYSLLAVLRKLSAPGGVYAVAGNHEYTRGIEPVADAFKQSHIKLMFDENKLIETPNGGKFNLIGVDYKTNPVDRKNNNLKRLIKPDMLNIALCHTPEDFFYFPDGIHLTLAGHTHGGQLNIPLLGSAVNPARYGRKYSYGNIIENNRQIFVTSGLGSAYTQARFCRPPEIVLITLESRSEK